MFKEKKELKKHRNVRTVIFTLSNLSTIGKYHFYNQKRVMKNKMQLETTACPNKWQLETIDITSE